MTGRATLAAVKVRIATITPQLAQRLIEAHNDHNRGIIDSRVNQYARDMREGRWIVNGEAIKISGDGQVLDGQHRLMAICQAGVPVQSLLVTGLPLEAQESMDQGRPRAFCDALKLRGEKDYIVLSCAIRIVATYEHSGCPLPGYVLTPSHQQLSASLARNPEIRDSVRVIGRLRQPWLSVSQAAGLHCLFAGADAGAADAFFTQLLSGENIEYSGTRRLRDLLIAAHAAPPGSPRMHKRVKCALIVKAWNAHIAGANVRVLEWRPPTTPSEPFPQISGLTSVAEAA